MNLGLTTLVNRAAVVNGPQSEDYVGEDGFLYCGVCHTRKQCDVEGLGRVYCACQCEQDLRERDREKRKQQETENRRRACFTNPLLEKVRVDMLDGKPAIIAARYLDVWEKMREEGTGILFWGDCGTGKTYAAAAITNELIERGCTARFRTVGEILEVPFDRKGEFRRKLCEKDLLVIDDLGAERHTTYGYETLHSLIDCRIGTGKPMIFTSNIPLTAMENETDYSRKRIYDRILGVCKPVQLTGQSRRRQANNHQPSV